MINYTYDLLLLTHILKIILKFYSLLNIFCAVLLLCTDRDTS